MAASPSPSPAVATVAVWLYDNNFVRVALVDVPVPYPNLVLFGVNYYVWSNIHWCYQISNPQTVNIIPGTAYVVSADTGAPVASVLAWPQQ